MTKTNRRGDSRTSRLARRTKPRRLLPAPPRARRWHPPERVTQGSWRARDTRDSRDSSRGPRRRGAPRASRRRGGARARRSGRRRLSFFFVSQTRARVKRPHGGHGPSRGAVVSFLSARAAGGRRLGLGAQTAAPLLERHGGEPDAEAVVAGVAPVAQHQPVLVPALAARAARHVVQVRPVQRVAVRVLVRLVARRDADGPSKRAGPVVASSTGSRHASLERFWSASSSAQIARRSRSRRARRVIVSLLPVSLGRRAIRPIRLRVDDLEPGLAQRALRLHLGPAHDARHAEQMRAAVKPAAVRNVVLADDAHVAEHQPGVGGERGHREPGRRARGARLRD